MPPARRFPISRRALTVSALVLLGPGRALAAPRPPVITMLGDSVTAGFGLPADAALPVQLGRSLTKLGVAAVVRGAGVSGDTTADGLARVGFSVQGDTSLCVVALGGNDLLQGVDPGVVRANLTAIVGKLKARRIPVVLAGLTAPPRIGPAYAREFDAVFPTVARTGGAVLYPDLFSGVGRDPRLLQRDGVHPNAAGAAIIAARLAPLVARALRRAPVIRLFAAVAIQDETAERLAALQSGLPGARWRPVEGLHVTLRFFGEIPEDRADDLDLELARVRGGPFDLVIEGAGAFGEGKDLDSVWAGVRPNPALEQLARRCEVAARRVGLKPDGRAYHPHVTLAYLRRPDPGQVGAWIQANNLIGLPTIRIESFGLYSSWLGGGPSDYRLERLYRLASAQRD